MKESRLFEDVHTAVEMSKAVAVPEKTTMLEVTAIEEGRREHPDGTTEEYRRVELGGR